MGIYDWAVDLFNKSIKEVVKPSKVIMLTCPQCGFKVFAHELSQGMFKIVKCECCNYETISTGQLVDINYEIDNSKAIKRGHHLTVDQLNELIKRGMPEEVAVRCLDLYNRFSIGKQDDFDKINILMDMYKIDRTQ